MKVGLYTNTTKGCCVTKEEEIIKKLQSLGFDAQNFTQIDSISGIDILMVLGGDGTILKVAAKCAQKNIAILGINLGNLGFLTEFEKGQEDKAIDLILSGKYILDSRQMLKAKCGEKVFYALNDVVIQRVFQNDCVSQVAKLTAKIDGEFVDTYTCDGLIVSTPTGSTAYSLSCGGSILTPAISAFCLTPICAHSLRSRPIVFSDNSFAQIIPDDSKAPTVLTCDGKTVCEVNSQNIVHIEKAPFSVNFVRNANGSFFNRLSKKLNEWSVE